MHESMFWTNLSGFLTAVALAFATNQMFDGVAFCMRNPEVRVPALPQAIWSVVHTPFGRGAAALSFPVACSLAWPPAARRSNDGTLPSAHHPHLVLFFRAVAAHDGRGESCECSPMPDEHAHPIRPSAPIIVR